MAGKNTSVFGIYRTGDAAEGAVDALIAAGFSSGDISVLLPDTRSSREFAHETDAQDIAAAGESAAADPADRRGSVDSRYTSDPWVVRDPRSASNARDPLGDPSDPAHPLHPRIYR